MVATAPFTAKAMKPVDIYAMGQKAGAASTDGHMETGMTRPMNRPAKGSSPAASQVDGPYGGKKKQS